MGLDISLYKVIKQTPDKKDEDFFTLSESPELNQFKSLAYERINEYYDMDKALKELGHNFDEVEHLGYEVNGDDTIFNYTLPNGESLDIKNPPLISKTQLCIDVEEVGYQRKGANKQFYDDNMWGSDCVTKLEVLQEHAKKYFDESFKTNIVDNFVEGETFVRYQ